VVPKALPGRNVGAVKAPVPALVQVSIENRGHFRRRQLANLGHRVAAHVESDAVIREGDVASDGRGVCTRGAPESLVLCPTAERSG